MRVKLPLHDVLCDNAMLKLSYNHTSDKHEHDSERTSHSVGVVKAETFTKTCADGYKQTHRVAVNI